METLGDKAGSGLTRGLRRVGLETHEIFTSICDVTPFGLFHGAPLVQTPQAARQRRIRSSYLAGPTGLSCSSSRVGMMS